MADLTADIAPQVVEACTANAEEAAGALGRAIDGECVLKPGTPTPRAELAAEALAGGGLLATFAFGEAGAIAALPAASGLLPDWVREPDPTGESKLSTLGQELSMLLVPDDLMADDFKAAWVDDLAAAIERTAPSDDAVALPIEVARGETLGTLTLLWPVGNVAAAFEAGTAPAEAAAPAPEDSEPTTANDASTEPTAEAEPATEAKPQPGRWVGPPPRDYRDLPPNTVSYLQVAVPVSVSLASRKMAIDEVIELGPGSIITFDKGCDEPLEICVGDQPIAQGAAVKVGEKFGVRLQEMILPEEHFRPMLPNKNAS